MLDVCVSVMQGMLIKTVCLFLFLFFSQHVLVMSRFPGFSASLLMIRDQITVTAVIFSNFTIFLSWKSTNKTTSVSRPVFGVFVFVLYLFLCL